MYLSKKCVFDPNKGSKRGKNGLKDPKNEYLDLLHSIKLTIFVIQYPIYHITHDEVPSIGFLR